MNLDEKLKDWDTIRAIYLRLFNTNNDYEQRLIQGFYSEIRREYLLKYEEEWEINNIPKEL